MPETNRAMKLQPAGPKVAPGRSPSVWARLRAKLSAVTHWCGRAAKAVATKIRLKRSTRLPESAREAKRLERQRRKELRRQQRGLKRAA